MSKNLFRDCTFYTSVNQLSQLPEDDMIEVAFAGRSNAGKSSAINVISDIKNLCRTSKTPGRTQMINYFQLTKKQDESDSEDTHAQRFLVDLPGYGYAKVPLKVKQHWQNLLERYLSERQSLRGVIVIMDIRHPLTEHDRVMLDWCRGANMPTHVLLTKMDKLNFGAAKSSLLKVQKTLKEQYPQASIQLFSALKKTGVDEARDILLNWLDFEAI